MQVSRPTLNAYRAKKKLRETRFRGRVQISKTDIIKKVVLLEPTDPRSLTILDNSGFESVHPVTGVFDLRNISAIDSYGLMTVLCTIKCHLKKNENNRVHLILDGSIGCSHLDSIGFFTEVVRSHSNRVFANYNDIIKRPQTRATVILPLHLIGYRGAEKKILEELYDPLQRQGFSQAYCGHIGWVIGELCDNAHTHANGPCYLVIEALESDTTQTRFLSIAVGDTGIGIPESLKTNSRYADKSDEILFPLAFQSGISRMDVEPKRGKGLNDVLSIAKGNRSWLRTDSNGLGLFFDFREAEEKITFYSPSIDTSGTRFCLLLIDSEFQEVSRQEINEIIQKYLEKRS